MRHRSVGQRSFGAAATEGIALHAWTEAYRSFLHLPSHQLEDTLNRVLVEAQQMSDRAVAESRMLFNELFDRLCEPILDDRSLLRRAVVHRPARYADPATQLANRYCETVRFQSLADRLDH